MLSINNFHLSGFPKLVLNKPLFNLHLLRLK